MKILGLIPARYGSTRFEGKPLVDIAGKTMIRRVVEQVSQAKQLAAVAVATDDLLIAEEVQRFGGQVIMTSTDHMNGTSRCAEAVNKMGGAYDVVINIQGDEPFIQPEQIDLLASLFQDASTRIGTLIKPLKNAADLDNPNIIKVVLDQQGNGMYFSRSAIPYIRGVDVTEWLQRQTFYKHIGIYGYRTAVLQKLIGLKPGILEQVESLEQLRWLEHGYAIRTALTHLETISIDVPADLEKLRESGLIR
jgi:3-deoxy-manno-octulosonate cytidylyltransferase (CMP-KDO synthetase)